MTKAEKIFRDTLYTCRRDVESWGFETNPNGRPIGYSRVICDCALCRRTFNAIQKSIDSYKRTLELHKKYGIISEERYKEELFVLDKVQVTLENSIKDYEKLGLL